MKKKSVANGRERRRKPLLTFNGRDCALVDSQMLHRRFVKKKGLDKKISCPPIETKIFWLFRYYHEH